MKLFQIKIRFLGNNTGQGFITLIDQSIILVEKFLDEIKYKKNNYKDF